MEKTVTIKLPLTRSEKEDVFVGINGAAGCSSGASRWKCPGTW